MVKPILSVVGIGAAVAIFFFFTQPMYDSVQALKQEVNQYNQALDKAAELQALKQSLLSRYNAFNPADLERLHKLLPDHVDNVRLVLDLDSLAAKHGMALQNVTVSEPASEATEKGVISAIGAGRQKYDSLTLRFSTQGTYESFRAFLQDLENSLRVVDLVSLKLDQSGLGGATPVYRYTITIRTYWLK